MVCGKLEERKEDLDVKISKGDDRNFRLSQILSVQTLQTSSQALSLEPSVYSKTIHRIINTHSKE